MAKYQEDAPILENRRLQNDYYQVDVAAESISRDTEPGQFVHVRLPYFEHRVLRRPFSIYNVQPEKGILSIIYKVVGEGTQHLSMLQSGDELNLMGPLGTGFSIPRSGFLPIIVAGGYGCAATYLLAKRSPVPCLCLLGGRSRQDLLLVNEFTNTGAAVRTSTDDGSEGHHGVVTDLLDVALAEADTTPLVYACGPAPMLRAVSRSVLARGLDAEVSLDHVMCCGVGACFACVVKMKADTPEGWEYVRTCKRGPVLKASQIYWE